MKAVQAADSTGRGAWHALTAPWRRASLRTKIHLSYLVLISVPLLIVALAAYETSTSTIEQNAQKFSAQLTGEIRKNLDTYEQQTERLTYWPFQDAGIQAVLRAYQYGPAQRSPRFRDAAIMSDNLAYLGHHRADIAGIYVVTRNGTLFSWTASGDLIPNPPMTGAPWYRAALAADPDTLFLPTQGQRMILVTTDKVFSLARAIHARAQDPGLQGSAASGALLGAVRVDIDAQALASVVQRVELSAQGRLLVLTPSGDVVYPIDPPSNVQRLARDIVAKRGSASVGDLQLKVSGQALLAAYDTSAVSGWIVAGVVPTDQLLTGANNLRTFILTIALLCILAGALCATLVVGRLTQPLRQLRGAMRRVEERDLNTRIKVRSEDEVGQLAHGFNTMLDELRRLVDDVLRAQIHEREAELHALQNQINPHFLYNTLESINMLALTHGDRDISRMVTSLGRLLRLTTSSTDALISLRDELDYVNHYLIVQRMRYGDRISMDVVVDESLTDCLLPKLTLQPLVENALYHGLEPRRGAGHVIVRGRRDGTNLVLTVEDDGVGMDASTLAAVQVRLEETSSRSHRSVGLANVHQRLKLYCGSTYGLAVVSLPGAGTTVTVRIPESLSTPAEDAHLSAPAMEREQGDVSLAHS